MHSAFFTSLMPTVRELPLLHPLPWVMLWAAPSSPHYGQSSCNGFCVLLDILQNCILVHPKQKRKQICLTCFLFRNKEPHTMRKHCIWPSTLLLQFVTSHCPFQELIPFQTESTLGLLPPLAWLESLPGWSAEYLNISHLYLFVTSFNPFLYKSGPFCLNSSSSLCFLFISYLVFYEKTVTFLQSPQTSVPAFGCTTKWKNRFTLCL